MMLFKINPVTNRLITITAVVQIFFILASTVFSFFAPLHREDNGFIVIVCGTGLFQVLLTLYMISLLAFLKEKQYIIIAFILYILVYIIRVVTTFTPAAGNSQVYAITVGILGLFSIFSIIFVFVGCMGVSNKTLLPAFIFWGLVSIGITVLKLCASLLTPYLFDHFSMRFNYIHYMRVFINAIESLSVLMPVAVILLVNGVNKLLKSETAAAGLPG